MPPLYSMLDPAWALPAAVLAVAVAAFALFRLLVQAAPAARAGPDGALGGVRQERRAAPRVKGGRTEAEVEYGADGPLAAWVLDRSAGGLCLLLGRPLPDRAAIQVRPRSEGALPWCPAVVCRCRAARVGWEAHVQFARPPGWGVLARFGLSAAWRRYRGQDDGT